jgi:hypothetical protein
LAKALGIRPRGHPPSNPSKRAFYAYDLTLIEARYLERNHHIVDMTDMLVATPGEPEEQRRSGTWATIRYASKQDKPLYIIYPDGLWAAWGMEGVAWSASLTKSSTSPCG